MTRVAIASHPVPRTVISDISASRGSVCAGWPKHVLAASSLIVAFAIPVPRIAGVIYLYDLLAVLAILVLRFPHSVGRVARRFAVAWWLLVAGVLIGFFSSYIRAGIGFRTVAYTAQFLLGLVYARSLFNNLASGVLSSDRLLRCILLGVLAASLLGIGQFLLLQASPALAHQAYRSYLSAGGQQEDMYDRVHRRAWEMTGQVRVVGGWTVTTSFGGMLALGMALVIFSDLKGGAKAALLTLVGVAVLMTQSRHAWIVGCVALLGLSTRRSLGLSFAWLSAAVVVIMTATYAVSLFQGEAGVSDRSLWDQITVRVDRTTEMGIEDSSLQARYVAGTLRFLIYGLYYDPTILLMGFGAQTEKVLGDTLGPDGLQYGYVSNSWLLSWRNWGPLAILSLFLLHWHLWRSRLKPLALAATVSALIILSDNYAVATPAPFLIIMSFIAVVWGSWSNFSKGTTPHARRAHPRPVRSTTDGPSGGA